MPEALDPRIGVIRDNGVQWPEQTIAGRPFRKPAQTTRDIGSGHFVVVDPFLPKGFDVEAVIVELSATIAPAEAEAAAVPDTLPEVTDIAAPASRSRKSPVEGSDAAAQSE